MTQQLFGFLFLFQAPQMDGRPLMFAFFLALGLLALPTQTTAVDAGTDDPIGPNAQQMLADGRQISATTRSGTKSSGATRSSCTRRSRSSRLTTRWLWA